MVVLTRNPKQALCSSSLNLQAAAASITKCSGQNLGKCGAFGRSGTTGPLYNFCLLVPGIVDANLPSNEHEVQLTGIPETV